MGKVNKKKFYRPGTLEIPGTMITLKTQPYTNGVVFDIADPISSFRAYVAELKELIHQYEYITQIEGINEVLANINTKAFKPEELGRLKLLLNFLVESPIEILLKEQTLTQDILTDLSAAVISEGTTAEAAYERT